MCLFWFKKKVKVNPQASLEKAILVLEKATHLISNEDLFTALEELKTKLLINLKDVECNVDDEIYKVIDQIYEIARNAQEDKNQKITYLISQIEELLNVRDNLVSDEKQDLKDFVIDEGKLIKYTGAAETVIVPSGVTIIGANAFYNNNKIKYVILKEGVVGIEENAFSQSLSLSEIELPSSLATIGQSAFYNCKGLTKVFAKEGLVSMNYYAFANCHSLVMMTIPKSVTIIKDNAFENCKKLNIKTVRRIKNINKKAL